MNEDLFYDWMLNNQHELLEEYMRDTQRYEDFTEWCIEKANDMVADNEENEYKVMKEGV